jgi:class 3 adenylate cyclase
MPTLKYKYVRVPVEKNTYGGAYTLNTLPTKQFEAFAPAALGLGNIARDGEYVHALAAMLDLEGFTAFCNQVDSHLVVPQFLAQYLEWLFARLKTEFQESATDERVRIWGSLPFFAKFMGDGVLFIWDTSQSGGMSGYSNIILNLWRVTQTYCSELVPALKRKYSKVPPRLRCGIARGQIMSVGDAGDYVGSCINIAARLQKLPGLTFAVSARGIDLEPAKVKPFWKDLVTRRVELRGIGGDELIYAHESELAKLRPRDRRFYAE